MHRHSCDGRNHRSNRISVNQCSFSSSISPIDRASGSPTTPGRSPADAAATAEAAVCRVLVLVLVLVAAAAVALSAAGVQSTQGPRPATAGCGGDGKRAGGVQATRGPCPATTAKQRQQRQQEHRRSPVHVRFAPCRPRVRTAHQEQIYYYFTIGSSNPPNILLNCIFCC